MFEKAKIERAKDRNVALVVIGGHSRSVGKTSVVAGLISALREFDWTAVKITQFGHGVCSTSGELCDCAVAEHAFAITAERQANSRTDTARFLAADARRYCDRPSAAVTDSRALPPPAGRVF